MWTPGRIAAIVYLALGMMVLFIVNVLVAGPWSTASYPHRAAELFCVLWVVAAVVSVIAMLMCLFMKPPRGMIVLAFAVGMAVSIIAAILNYVLLVIILMSV